MKVFTERVSSTDSMSKNTARHIFSTRRMDLSDTSLKALESQVLSYSRDEVRHTLTLERWALVNYCRSLIPVKGGRAGLRYLELVIDEDLHLSHVIVHLVSMWAVCWTSLPTKVAQRSQGVSASHTGQPVWCDSACAGVHQLQHPLPGRASCFILQGYLRWTKFLIYLVYL